MGFEHIELQIGDSIARPIARLVLDRPDRRNALSLALMREMLAALEAVADEKAPVLVIEGRGPAFSAGHDLGEIVATREAEFYEELFGTCVELMTRLHTIPQPVIAKVHGVATAAGCQLVAACDLAIASDDARFATPGVNIGLFCSTPMVPVERNDRAQARARDAVHRRHDRRAHGRGLGTREPRRAEWRPGGGRGRARRPDRSRARRCSRSASARSTSRKGSTSGPPTASRAR